MNEKNPSLSKSFPKKLKQLRINRGWSQGQLAKKIGIEHNRISRYENGALWPTLELLVRIANVYEVSLDYLIRDVKGVPLSRVGNPELLKKVEEVEQLSQNEQNAVIDFLDAYVKRSKFESMMQR